MFRRVWACRSPSQTTRHDSCGSRRRPGKKMPLPTFSAAHEPCSRRTSCSPYRVAQAGPRCLVLPPAGWPRQRQLPSPMKTEVYGDPPRQSGATIQASLLNSPMMLMPRRAPPVSSGSPGAGRGVRLVLSRSRQWRRLQADRTWSPGRLSRICVHIRVLGSARGAGWAVIVLDQVGADESAVEVLPSQCVQAPVCDRCPATCRPLVLRRFLTASMGGLEQS